MQHLFHYVYVVSSIFHFFFFFCHDFYALCSILFIEEINKKKSRTCFGILNEEKLKEGGGGTEIESSMQRNRDMQRGSSFALWLCHLLFVTSRFFYIIDTSVGSAKVCARPSAEHLPRSLQKLHIRAVRRFRQDCECGLYLTVIDVF